MRSVLRGVAGGLALLVIGDAIASRFGWAPGLVPRADGPWIWVASRSAGLVAYLALTLDVVFGLFLSTGAADRFIARARSLELHRWLSGVAIALAAAHGVALAFDATVHFDALDVLVPFISSYRPFAVGLGIAALYALYVVRESFKWRARLGARVWRKLHMLAFAAFVMVTAHGIFAGSDTHRPWMLALYIVAVAVVAGLSAYRWSAPPVPTAGRGAPRRR